MFLDALGCLLLAFFALLGALRGALLSGLSLASLGVSYAAGLWAGARLGPWVGVVLQLPPLLGGVVAASGVFLTSLVALAALGALLGRWERSRLEGGRREAWDRLGGAGFGAARGALLVVLIGWLAHWLDAAAAVQQLDRRPLTEASMVGEVAQTLVEAAAGAALESSHSETQIGVRLLARPTETLPQLQSVMEHPRIQRLAADQTFWEMVQFGAVDRAVQRASFVSIAQDKELRGHLASLGLIDEGAAADPVVFRRSVQEVLERVGPRIRRLRQDPELRRLARDPEVVALLEERQMVALLLHPGFQHLLSRVLEEGTDL